MFKFLGALVVVFGLLWVFSPSQPKRQGPVKGVVTPSKMTEPVLLDKEQQQMFRYLRAQFRKEPALVKIAFCESSFRHVGQDGNVTVGPTNDVGVMQIAPIHLTELATLGLDPTKLEDNVRFARHLYQKKGLAPWKSTQGCWGEQKVFLAQK